MVMSLWTGLVGFFLSVFVFQFLYLCTPEYSSFCICDAKLSLQVDFFEVWFQGSVRALALGLLSSEVIWHCQLVWYVIWSVLRWSLFWSVIATYNDSVAKFRFWWSDAWCYSKRFYAILKVWFGLTYFHELYFIKLLLQGESPTCQRGSTAAQMSQQGAS